MSTLKTLQRTRRASPLSPSQRRAALIAATLPLVRAHGTDVSTREIAEAAGVAEGTLFRVFPSKDALIAAVVATAFDPSPVLEQLAAVDRSTPLEDRLTAVAGILQRRLSGVFHLIHRLGLSRPSDFPRGRKKAAFVAAHSAVLEAIAALIAPDRERLRYSPQEAARRLRMLVFAATHPQITEQEPLEPEEIVSMFLDGIRLSGPRGANRATPSRRSPRC